MDGDRNKNVRPKESVFSMLRVTICIIFLGDITLVGLTSVVLLDENHSILPLKSRVVRISDLKYCLDVIRKRSSSTTYVLKNDTASDGLNQLAVDDDMSKLITEWIQTSECMQKKYSHLMPYICTDHLPLMTKIFLLCVLFTILEWTCVFLVCMFQKPSTQLNEDMASTTESDTQVEQISVKIS